MAYTTLDPQPANLTTGEVAYSLDDGTLVAISINAKWLDNNGGVWFNGVARHINADGTSCLCGNGNPVQTSCPHTADLNQVQTLGQNAIAKEVQLALLGEPATTEVVDGETVPLIRWSTDFLNNASIKVAAQIAAATGQIDLSGL